MDVLYIVMPAYNEEDNIEAVVKKWYSKLESASDKSRIVIADKGSTDKTHGILKRLQVDYPKLDILYTDNQYHGPKVIALYDYAIRNGADYIFQTDSDGQTNPDEFDSFWEKRMEYAGIFGNRTMRGDGKDRAFVEKIVCLLLKVYFKVEIPDANAPFRLMKAKTVKKYLPLMKKDYELPNIMLTTFFKYYHEIIMFEAISFKPRLAGKNSINIPRIIKIGLKALGDFRKFKGVMKLEKGNI